MTNAHLETIKELHKRAYTMYVILFFGCLYSLLIIFTTMDLDFFTKGSTIFPLPFLKTTIPIYLFYIFGPIALLLIFIYFQLRLVAYWESIRELRSDFEVELSEIFSSVTPSSFSFLAERLWRYPGTRHKAKRLEHLGLYFSMFMIWWLVPLTCFGIWAHYLVKQGLLGTMIQFTTFSLATLFSIRFYYAYRKIFTYQDHDFFSYINYNMLFSLVLFFMGVFSVFHVRDKYKMPFDFIYADLSPNNFINRLVVRNNLITNDATISLDRIINFQNESLRFADACGANLSGVNFSGADGHLSQFDHANIERCLFKESKMIGANFNAATLNYCDFSQCNLKSAIMSNINSRFVVCSSAYMRDVNFYNSLFVDCAFDAATFRESSYNNSTFTQCSFIDSRFDESILTKVIISKSDLSGAFFPGSQITSVEITYSRLSSVNFENSKITHSCFCFSSFYAYRNKFSKFNNSIMHECDFSFSNIRRTYFNNSKIISGDFSASDLRYSQFNKTRLTRSLFKGADLEGTDFQEAVLNHCDFSSASLRHADLSGAKFHDTNLKGCDLTGADLRGADLSSVQNLETAHLKDILIDGQTKLPQIF